MSSLSLSGSSLFGACMYALSTVAVMYTLAANERRRRVSCVHVVPFQVLISYRYCFSCTARKRQWLCTRVVETPPLLRTTSPILPLSCTPALAHQQRRAIGNLLLQTRLLGRDEVPDHLRVSDWLSPNVVKLGDPPVEVSLGGCIAVVVVAVTTQASRGGGAGGSGTNLSAAPPLSSKSGGRKPKNKLNKQNGGWATQSHHNADMPLCVVNVFIGWMDGWSLILFFPTPYRTYA